AVANVVAGIAVVAIAITAM
ncbi:hypothetical protein A2U01_0061006, partial [Trifolium medium]|nr:hypothetical protein [Trifolium medium]